MTVTVILLMSDDVKEREVMVTVAVLITDNVWEMGVTVTMDAVGICNGHIDDECDDHDGGAIDVRLCR